MTAPDDVRAARAFLSSVAEPGAPVLATFVAQHGPVAAADAIRDRTCPRAVLEETATDQRCNGADIDLDAAADDGIRLVIPEDEEWPETAFNRPAVVGVIAPLSLWVRGTANLHRVTTDAVTITGSRAASGYGEHVAGELATDLGHRGYTVLSGAAYGIDSAAHRGVLAAGGTTVAILGCGVDVGYPAGHVGLLDKIVEHGGLLVSEYPPGTPPARHRFLARNRLLAGLGAGTVVVEAGRRSSALHTARMARAMGNAAMALPGPVTSAASAGCHQLIQEGHAILVTGSGDVLDVLDQRKRDQGERHR